MNIEHNRCACGNEKQRRSRVCWSCHTGTTGLIKGERPAQLKDLAKRIRQYCADNDMRIGDFIAAGRLSSSFLTHLERGQGGQEQINRALRVLRGETLRPIPQPAKEHERALMMSRLAKETKGPGQTIHARLKELQREMVG